MSDAPWHLAHAGAETGPLTTEQLVEGLAAGRIPSRASAWREGMDGWKPVSQIPELRTAAASRGFDAMPRRQLLLLGGLALATGGLVLVANVTRTLAGQDVGAAWAGIAGGIMAPGAFMLWKALRRR